MTRSLLRHLFLDLDGTLVDPFEGITQSLSHALRALGRPVPPRSELKSHIGPPLSNAFRTLLGTSDDVILRAAIDAYRERYSEVGVLENEVYVGIPQVLGALRDHGLDLHLLTSKPTFMLAAFSSTPGSHLRSTASMALGSMRSIFRRATFFDGRSTLRPYALRLPHSWAIAVSTWRPRVRTGCSR